MCQSTNTKLMSEKIKVMIVEDKPIIAQDMAMMLRKYNYEVAGIALDFEDALEILKTKKVDIALLDINLESEKTGIDLAKIIREKYRFPFIFLTAYSDQKTLDEVLETNPHGYLVKPLEFKEVNANIVLALNNFQAFNKDKENESSIDDVSSEFIWIKDKRNLIKLKPNDILFAQAFDNYAYVYLNDRKILMTDTLKIVEAKLAYPQFIRVHRSYLINLRAIEEIQENTIIIKDHRIPISRRFQQGFYEKLNVL